MSCAGVTVMLSVYVNSLYYNVMCLGGCAYFSRPHIYKHLDMLGFEIA